MFRSSSTTRIVFMRRKDTAALGAPGPQRKRGVSAATRPSGARRAAARTEALKRPLEFASVHESITAIFCWNSSSRACAAITATCRRRRSDRAPCGPHPPRAEGPSRPSCRAAWPLVRCRSRCRRCEQHHRLAWVPDEYRGPGRRRRCCDDRRRCGCRHRRWCGRGSRRRRRRWRRGGVGDAVGRVVGATVARRSRRRRRTCPPAPTCSTTRNPRSRRARPARSQR